jgi:outer membrane protein OmpA-like peptidoglycan-associated protein
MHCRSLACLTLLAVLPLAALAEDPTARGFDADPVKPALSLEGGFAVETARLTQPGARAFRAVLDLGGGLMVLKLGRQRDDLIEQRLTLHLLGGWSFDRFELGVHLPVALRQQTDFSLLATQGVTGPLVAPIAGTALGDLRLGAKLKLLDGATWPLDLAVLGDLRLPTGDRQAFMGDGLALATSLIGSRSLGRIRIDGQLGYLFRGTGQYAQLVVHDGFNAALGGSLDLPPLRQLARWKAIAELTGGWPRGYQASSDRYRAPLSARAGLRAWFTPQWSGEIGLGTGIGVTGYGHERWRVFLGVGWAAETVGPPDGDDDGDGVPNSRDLCPKEPGPAELDGCPDRDGDGIPDREDRCPDQPGPAENAGCPLSPTEPLVELKTSRLSLNDSIHFDTGMDTITPGSHAVLDQVAALITQHAELKLIRVEGHTDNVGAADYNKDLSARRAASVVRFLVAAGVEASRLEAAGYGYEKPIASNLTALGRARNRRVEFTIPPGAP